MSLTKVTYSMIKGAYANVLDFGAAGNGIADDTSAIQAAINAVSGGGRVYIPNGVYITTSPLTLSDGVCITGESQFNTIIDSTATDVFKSALDFMQTVVRPEIENLYIKCRGNDKVAINIIGFQYGKFSRLIIELFGTNSKGVFGTAVSGASPYYNRFYEVDMAGGANASTNGNIGYALLNKYTGDVNTEKRAPNGNVIIGGRLQGFQTAYQDIGVGNVVIGTCFESNHNVFDFGRDPTDGGIFWGPASTGNSRVYGVYLEDNTGTWFKVRYSSGGVVLEPAYNTGLTGTQLDDQGTGTSFLIWGSQDINSPARVGGYTYFLKPIKITHSQTLLGDGLVAPAVNFDNVAGGNVVLLQGNSFFSSLEALRAYNSTLASTVWRLSNTGEGQYSKGVGGNAFATASRPTVDHVGTMIFDTTLGKPIWWNGTVWKDATGATV